MGKDANFKVTNLSKIVVESGDDDLVLGKGGSSSRLAGRRRRPTRPRQNHSKRGTTPQV